MKYYNNGKNEKRFNDDDIVPKGWVKGRLISPITTAGKSWYNNGINEVLSDIQPNGYTKGRLKFSKEWSLQRSISLKEKHYHYYNNGINEILLQENSMVPEGFVKGRLPMTVQQKEKLSKSHIGMRHTDEAKKKISLHSNNNREKAKQTSMEKYGVPNAANSIQATKKRYETMAKNNTFNASKPEDTLYEELVNNFGKDNVLRHYKCDRYPFYCDFYIKSEDKFIELNAHWTHGGKPFDSDDVECLEKLNLWKEKAKTSQFYKNAIETWTVRDVNKINVSKINNLNIEFIY